MKQKPTYARPATAAIAAVLAALSTPAMAQNSAPSGAMDPAMAPIVPPPVQPQSQAQPAPAVKPAPAPVAATRRVTPPRIAPLLDEAPEVPTVARAEAPEQAPAATRSASASTSRAMDNSSDAASVADAAEGSIVASQDAPVAPVAAAESLDTGIAAGEASSEAAFGEEELALAALAGLLGLGAMGGVMVARRRRKPLADAPAAVVAAPTEIEPEPVVAPATARTQPAPPARKAAPLGESRVQPAASGSLVDQIDYTKPAGYYESMVDQGPSPINPFLTRRKRIARAKFLDRELERAEERKLAERSGEDFATRLRRPALV